MRSNLWMVNQGYRAGGDAQSPDSTALCRHISRRHRFDKVFPVPFGRISTGSDELLKRRGDCVWRVRRRGERLVLLEFQSTDEPGNSIEPWGETSPHIMVQLTGEIGAPGEIRTPDPLVRSQVLYPS